MNYKKNLKSPISKLKTFRTFLQICNALLRSPFLIGSGCVRGIHSVDLDDSCRTSVDDIRKPQLLLELDLVLLCRLLLASSPTATRIRATKHGIVSDHGISIAARGGGCRRANDRGHGYEIFVVTFCVVTHDTKCSLCRRDVLARTRTILLWLSTKRNE